VRQEQLLHGSGGVILADPLKRPHDPVGARGHLRAMTTEGGSDVAAAVALLAGQDVRDVAVA
jgi:hypothetical protein